jgi:hypothetical protein
MGFLFIFIYLVANSFAPGGDAGDPSQFRMIILALNITNNQQSWDENISYGTYR